jgi:hypothetical protein
MSLQHQLLSYATRYITKGFLAQGLSPQFVDMYEAVNQMTRQKVMDSFEHEAFSLNAEETLQPLGTGASIDQNAANIDEMWSTLFGLGNFMENDLPQVRNDQPYRF